MGAAVRLKWEQAAAWRVRRHHLQERAPRRSALAVVADIGGLHAQLTTSAELTLWARVEGLRPGEVATDLWDERRLVKTWAMRGTLHLLPADEYGLWQAALSTYDHYVKPSWMRAFGMSPPRLEELLAAIAEALDGPMLTRDELADEVGRLTGSPSLGDKLRQSWGSLLKPAAYRGLLCFAPSRGQNVRFTRPDRWLARGPTWDPQDALVEVCRRFLAANGPTTIEALARWWATSPARARALVQRMGEQVRPVEVDGRDCWMVAGDLAEASRLSATTAVRLLPAFDQYVVTASRQDPEVLSPDHRARVYRSQGWFSPVVLVGGRMVGVWRHERRGARLTVAVEPFGTLPAPARRAVEAEADRLAAFLGAEPELSWEP